MHQPFSIYTQPQNAIDWAIQYLRDGSYDPFNLNQWLIKSCEETLSRESCKEPVNNPNEVIRELLNAPDYHSYVIKGKQC